MSKKEIPKIKHISERISEHNEIEEMKDKIEADSPHYANETICVKCLHREISVYPVGTPLKILQCGGCFEHGYVILTGENV